MEYVFAAGLSDAGDSEATALGDAELVDPALSCLAPQPTTTNIKAVDNASVVNIFLFIFFTPFPDVSQWRIFKDGMLWPLKAKENYY
jgi:hypothetical protein